MQHALMQPIPSVTDATGKYFHHYVLPQKRNGVSPDWVIVFYTQWCGICDEVADPLREVAPKFRTDKLKFMKVDVSGDEGAGERLGVKSFPAVVFVRGGSLNAASHFEGERTVSNMQRWLSELPRGRE